MCVTECRADAITPRLLVTGVVDLVEDHETLGGQPGELRRGRSGGDLLIGRDESVHIASEPVARRPVGVQFEAESMCGERPLGLQMARRCDDDQRPGLLGERGPAQVSANVVLPAPGVATARKSCGSIRRRARGPTGREQVECGALPGAEE